MKLNWAAISLVFAAMSASLMAQDIGDQDILSSRRSARRNAMNPYPFTLGCNYTTTDYTFGPGQTGTGYDESFTVMTPCLFDPMGPDLPLIVMFNGFCLGPPAIFNNSTQIPDEANLRGWMIVAIRCGGQALLKKSYGIYRCQPNVEQVLDFVIANYPVDEDRIYGVGWSAGGGAIASYGARHLNPDKPMFAAIATNAGTFDIVNTYNTVASDVKAFLSGPLMFQGTPSNPSFLFGYLRTSTLLTSPPNFTVEPEASTAGNLVPTPLLHVYSTDDIIAGLPQLNVAFNSYLAGLGANLTTIPFTGLQDPHSWDLLDPVSTLDFLALHTLDREPASFKITADRDEKWYWADITQRTTGVFSYFDAAVEASTNQVELTGVDNVAAMTLSPPASEFDPNQNFQVRLQTLESDVTDVVVENVATAPTYVLKGVQNLFTNWEYIGAQQRLVFHFTGGGSQLLSVRYDDYSATLTGPTSIATGAQLNLSLAGSTPNRPYILFLGFSEGVIPIDLFDPNDSRNLLVGFATPPVLFQSALNGAATSSIGFPVPNDPSLGGKTLRCQLVTFPGGATIVDEISKRLDVSIVSS